MATAPALILVVDSDPDIRSEVQKNLQLLGFGAHVVETVEAARNAMAGLRPNLIVMGLRASHPEDFAFCSWVRRQPDQQRLPIVALVEPSFTAHCEQAFWVGVSDFCFKPLQSAILIQRVCLLLDIDKMARELTLTRERLAATQRAARVGTWDLEIGDMKLALSEEALRILGLDAGRFDGQLSTLLSRVHPDDQAGVQQIARQALVRPGPIGVDCRLVLPDGAQKWVSGRGETAFNLKGQPLRVAGTVQDVTERRENLRALHQLSSFDPLTGLPNRQQFTQQLERAIGHCRFTQHKLAVVHLGMNRFKRVNESLGHQAGDELLGQIAQRIKTLLRNNDFISFTSPDYDGDANLARFGGDEFVILLGDLQREQDAALVASRLLGDLARTYLIQGQEVALDAAAGISLFPDHGEVAKDLINHAEAAMHFAKQGEQGSYGGGYGFYNSAIGESARMRLTMENDLRRALEREELRPFYQPKVDATGRIRAAEMLLRWRHPTLGMLTPDKFITLAEEAGLIIPISEWLIKAGAKQLGTWQKQSHTDISLAINLSPPHFRDPALVDSVREALRENELPPGSLELELTEGMLMEDLDETMDILNALKDAGARLAIDDFGTGYSSLSYLTRLPVDVLKIDRSFVRDITRDASHRNIVKAIIAMAHSLELEVVAEGVEYKDQAELLRELDCDLIQGYLYGRPMPAMDLSVNLASVV